MRLVPLAIGAGMPRKIIIGKDKNEPLPANTLIKPAKIPTAISMAILSKLLSSAVVVAGAYAHESVVQSKLSKPSLNLA